jgi:predicted Fe-Mo cluster-binding NifX family protein
MGISKSSTRDGVTQVKHGTVVLTLVVTFLIACSAPNGENRIAIASEGTALQDVTCKSAGRCPHFLLFGLDGELEEVVDNPFKNAPGDAGPQAARLLAEKKSILLFAGSVGPRMEEILESSGIECIAFMGKVEEALNAALQGDDSPGVSR